MYALAEQALVVELADGEEAADFIDDGAGIGRDLLVGEDEKPVAQLCHAGLALAAAGVLEGRRTAAYPELEHDVKVAGGEFVDGAGVVDGMMVSARAWPDHPEWMREFMKVLKQHAPVEAEQVTM